MNYYEVIDRAIIFMEANLYENFLIEDVAKEVGFSLPHFYRIFSALVGESPKSYIRKRRLSDSAFMLKNSEMKICDIAFHTGFDSHEVFIRAFKKMYGVTPKEIKSLERLALFEQFNPIARKKTLESEVIIIQTETIIKSSFKIIGKTITLNQAEQNQHNLIHKFIVQFEKEKEYLPNMNHQDSLISMYEYDPDVIQEDDENVNYHYTLGLQWDDDEPIPNGFNVKEIPSAKYALFVHDANKNTLNGIDLSSLTYEGEPIHSIYDYIDGVWVINSGHTLSESPDFEIRNPNNQGITEYYISIQS